jgi:hypothetical protein
MLHRLFSFFQSQRSSMSIRDWQIFFAAKRHQNARFLAFHEVKCGSEHSRQIPFNDRIRPKQKSPADE